MRRFFNKIPEKERPKIVYKGTKLSSRIPIKDKIKTLQNSNLIYKFESSHEQSVNYIGETKCRLEKRIEEYQGKDKESAIFKNFTEKDLPRPSPSEFCVLAKNYQNRLKRKIAEAIFIKEQKPSLNIQKDSYKLELWS